MRSLEAFLELISCSLGAGCGSSLGDHGDYWEFHLSSLGALFEFVECSLIDSLVL